MARVLTRPVVVTATATIRNIPTEVRLGPEDGMPRECVLALDNIERVSAVHFQRYITSLRHEKILEVCRALAIATGCQPA